MSPNTVRKGTGKTAVALAAIVAAGLIIIGLIIYALTIPGVFESLVTILIYAIGIIAVIALVAFAIYSVSSVVVYATKGEITQTDGEYSIDDVEPVENSSGDTRK